MHIDIGTSSVCFGHTCWPIPVELRQTLLVVGTPLVLPGQGWADRATSCPTLPKFGTDSTDADRIHKFRGQTCPGCNRIPTISAGQAPILEKLGLHPLCVCTYRLVGPPEGTPPPPHNPHPVEANPLSIEIGPSLAEVNRNLADANPTSAELFSTPNLLTFSDSGSPRTQTPRPSRNLEKLGIGCSVDDMSGPRDIRKLNRTQNHNNKM